MSNQSYDPHEQNLAYLQFPMHSARADEYIHEIHDRLPADEIHELSHINGWAASRAIASEWLVIVAVIISILQSLFITYLNFILV
jgi:hypothetical protein